MIVKPNHLNLLCSPSIFSCSRSPGTTSFVDMAPSQSPSIQSFFQPSSSPSSSPSRDGQSPTRPLQTAASELADGFSSTEVNRVLCPTVENWVPERDYEEKEIGSLIPGPRAITVVGRIVNFYDQTTPSKMPQAAKGCIKIIVKDNTGALTVL